MTATPDEAALLRATITQRGDSLAALSQASPVLLVLLRHEGCTFCRNAMSDIARLRPRIEHAGTLIVLGHMSTPEGFAAFAERYGLGSVAAVSDPERGLYRTLGLKRARWMQLLGPRVLWQWLMATLRGHGTGLVKGDSTQMPGAFLLHQGRVVKRYQYRDAADRPDYVNLATLPS
jgi:peroxiredoxin